MNLFVRQTFIKQFLRQRFFSLKSIKNRHQNRKMKVRYAKKIEIPNTPNSIFIIGDNQILDLCC